VRKKKGRVNGKFKLGKGEVAGEKAE